MPEHRQVIIIGSGPAGLTAAIYSARANLSPLVIEGEPSSTSDQPGGQLMLTTEVENYPGFPEGIMGPDLMQNFRSQAERFGASFLTQKVTRVDFSHSPFQVWIGDPNAEEASYSADSVIVSTGARSVMLELPNEFELVGHGLSTCATCDGFFFRDQEIAVVGGGDSAMEEATFLSRFASKVTIIHRRDVFKASKVMYERALNNPKIEIKTFKTIKKWLSDENGIIGAILQDSRDNSEEEISCTGAFIAIGHKPITKFLENQVETDESGYIIPNIHTMTSVPGIFAAGDVVDTRYRQAITAAGMGCQAAIDTEKWLEDQH